MCLSVRRVHVYLWEAVHVVKMSRSRPTSSDRRRPGLCRSARTESQCRARFGFCDGESKASRLSLMAGVAQGRDRGAIPRGRVMMMSAGVAGWLSNSPTTHPPHTQEMPAPRPLHSVSKHRSGQHVRYAPRASFPPGRQDPVARAMRAAMFRGRSWLGRAGGRREVYSDDDRQ